MTYEEELAHVVEKYWEINKVPHDAFARDFLKQCQSCSVRVNHSIYKYYRRGSGPTVLLVHGYNTNLGTMVAIAEDLVEQGYRVVLFDAPAHGAASGTHTNPLEVRDLLRKIASQVGTLHAVVAYSLGVVWTLAAWGDEFQAQRLIAIAAPSNFTFSVEKFVAMQQIKKELADGLTAQLEQRFGAGMWQEFSPSAILKNLALPGLIIHGTHDDFVPPLHAAQLQENWRGAKTEMLDGIGHFEIPALAQTRKLITTYLHDQG